MANTAETGPSPEPITCLPLTELTFWLALSGSASLVSGVTDSSAFGLLGERKGHQVTEMCPYYTGDVMPSKKSASSGERNNSQGPFYHYKSKKMK